MTPAFKPIAAFAVAAAIVCASPAYAQQANLTGDWTGGYAGEDGVDANRFDVKLVQRGAALSGTITELNAIGDAEQVLFLTSTLQGRVSAGSVTFEKTYDGSGGVSHSVRYTGILDVTGRRIRGTYDAGGATGQFEMVR